MPDLVGRFHDAILQPEHEQGVTKLQLTKKVAKKPCFMSLFEEFIREL